MTASPGATYVHDKVGNRTKKTIGTPSLGNYTNIGWDAMNRMIGTESYASNQLTVANQYRYRADGLRTMKILGDEESTVPYEELSSYYDFNYWRNNRTWTYGYDGQMSVLELYKGETHEGNIVQDATRNTLGGRGIDMIVAERTWGPSGDPLLYQKRKQYPLFDGMGICCIDHSWNRGDQYRRTNLVPPPKRTTS